MMATVKRGGTASNVNVAGYSVAGKTGTANKVKNGQYMRDVVASFVGIVPATQPRFIVAVMVDEPKKGRFGGLVAAPVFNEVGHGCAAHPDGFARRQDGACGRRGFSRRLDTDNAMD